MGTKAVFAVSSSKDKFFTTILGMTANGFPESLEYTAYLFIDVAKKLRLLTKVRKRDFDSIKKVMEAIQLGTDGDIFVDDLKNAAWVSYSCVFDPDTNILQHYDRLFETKTKVFEVPKCVEMWKQKNK